MTTVASTTEHTKKPNRLALEFRGDAIALFALWDSTEWQNVYLLPLDQPDFQDRTRDIRRKATDLTGDPSPRIDIWLPQEQVLSLDLADGLPLFNPLAKRRAIASAISARTDVAPAELYFDDVAVEAGHAISVTERAVVSEARAYAKRWGFRPARITTRHGHRAFVRWPTFGGAERYTVPIGIGAGLAAAGLALFLTFSGPDPLAPIEVADTPVAISEQVEPQAEVALPETSPEPIEDARVATPPEEEAAATPPAEEIAAALPEDEATATPLAEEIVATPPAEEVVALPDPASLLPDTPPDAVTDIAVISFSHVDPAPSTAKTDDLVAVLVALQTDMPSAPIFENAQPDLTALSDLPAKQAVPVVSPVLPERVLRDADPTRMSEMEPTSARSFVFAPEKVVPIVPVLAIPSDDIEPPKPAADPTPDVAVELSVPDQNPLIGQVLPPAPVMPSIAVPPPAAKIGPSVGPVAAKEPNDPRFATPAPQDETETSEETPPREDVAIAAVPKVQPLSKPAITPPEAAVTEEIPEEEVAAPPVLARSPLPISRPDRPEPEPEPEPTELALATAPQPAARPKSIKPRVTTILTDRSGTGAKTVKAPSRGGPVGPGVANAATLRDAIQLEDMNLLGVFGSSKSRRALLRMPDGQVMRVKQGSVVDGWVVSRISETTMRITRGGQAETLKIVR